MPRTDVTIIEAPSSLGLTTPGVSALAEALLARGLAERLPARRGARLAPLPPDDERDPATRLLNAPQIADFAARLADEVAAVLDRGGIPLVLGGDCSI
ncbi:hypothetical protein J8J27_24345, partial [Mycobacterium tuberculosis]|nr:hypothetical protein [Mycobacterium tuberculosis]